MTESNTSIPKIRPENIKILCVDNDETTRNDFERIFKFRAYDTTVLRTKAAALTALQQKDFDIILVNASLPDGDGLDVLRTSKELNVNSLRILTTATDYPVQTTDAINQGGIYGVINQPWNEEALMKFVTGAVELTMTRKENILQLEEATKNNLKLSALVTALETQAIENSVLLHNAKSKVQSTYVNTIKTFLRFIEVKNPSLHSHSKRVGHFAMQTAQIAGLSEDEIQNILIAGLLHDLGKLGLSDKVLLSKPHALADSDANAYQRHPKMAADSLLILEDLDDVLNIIYSHHEHFDGSGFPRGLKAHEISPGSRILAIVEAYEEYKFGVRDYNDGHHHAISMLIKYRDTYYCPTMLDCFLKLFA